MKKRLKLISKKISNRKDILKVKTGALLAKTIFNYHRLYLFITHPKMIKEKIRKYKKQSKKLIPYVIGLAIIVLIISIVSIKKDDQKIQLETAPKSSGYLYQRKSKGFAVYLGNRTNEKVPSVGFVSGEAAVNLSLANNVDEKVKFERINEKSVVYHNIHPGIDLIYTLTETGVKEEIKINSPEALSYLDRALSFALDLSNAVPQKDLMGNLLPTFIDPVTNQYRFHFEKPFMIDAGGNKSNDISLNIESSPNLSQNSQAVQYQAKFKPNLNWLNTAIYPVIIDPTIVHDTQSEFSGTFNRTEDIGVGETAPSVELTEQELTADIHTVGLWHMNETVNDSCSGGQDTCDSSGNGNHGTATGTTINTTTQKFGAARTIAATNYISVANSTSLNPTNAITIEAWVYQISSNTNSGIVYKGSFSSTQGIYSLQIGDGSNSKVVFRLNQSITEGAGQVTSNTILSTNQWYHIVAVYDKHFQKIFINGVEDNSKAYSTAISTDANNLYIGAYYSSSFSFIGTLDEIRISNVARTPEEIKLDAQKRPYGVYTSQSIDLGTSVVSLDSLQWSEQLNPPLGTGTDGEITVAANKNINTDTMIVERSCADGGDAVNYSVIANISSDQNQITLSSTPSTGCLAVGNEVLVINLQGTSTNNSGVGNYETHYIKSINNAVLTLYGNLRYNYDGTTQKIMVQRVPNYTSVSISGGATLTASAWNGTKNGVLFFRANGTVTIGSGTSITASSLGYQAGAGATSGTATGVQGESYQGTGIATTTANVGGGGGSQGEAAGATAGAGGGGYGTSGTTGEGPTNGANPGTGGSTYGNVALSSLFLGSGGGGGGRDSYYSSNGGNGGKGGGIIFIAANTLTVSGTISSNGAVGSDGQANPTVKAGGGGGGGSGGSIFIAGPTVTVGSSLVTSSAGAGGVGGQTVGDGGAGGSGRITVYYTSSLSGSTNPSAFIGTFSNPLADIEFQTRTSANNSTWEEWKPVSNETAIASMDSDAANWSTSNANTLTKSDESTLKMEGSGSLKSTVGAPQVDGNTVGLWHFDETGVGTGSTAYDSTTNNNHGTATGTTLTEGFYGKARSFNGSSDNISIPGQSIPTGNQITISFWTYGGSTLPANNSIIGGHDASGNRVINIHLAWSDGTIYWDAGNSGTSSYDRISKAVSASDYKGRWAYWTFTKDASTGSLKIYLDGNLWHSGTGFTRTLSSVTTAKIGSDSGSTVYYPGKVDEFKIDNIELTAEQIAEAYRAGRDHRIERTLSSTNLSDKNKIPFYVASDRPGTYLETYTGETSNSVYGSDTNTVGLWHLDEKSGSGAYIKDSSGNANNGTPTGTTFTQGKIGSARNFNGTADQYINLSNNASLSLTTFTVSAWFQWKSEHPSDIFRTIISKNATGSGYDTNYQIFVKDSMHTVQARIGHGTSETNFVCNDAINANQWYKVDLVYNSTTGTGSIYLNGQLCNSYSGLSTAYTNASANVTLGYWQGATYGEWDGIIDEVQISNTARTADEIRQAYQYGLRTHQITVDYSTTAGSDGPTSTSDLSFTPDTTTGLYVGDIVIVRENVDGTSYIMQGEVNSISSGLVTVSSWSGTAPSGGYSTNADVFKWQREYWDITDISPGDRDAITKLGIRVLDGSEGFNMYLDDFRSNSTYMTDPSGSSISSTTQRYFQYRAILTTNDTLVSPALTSVTLNYTNNAPSPPTALLTEGQTNPSGVDDTTPEFSAIYNDDDAGDIANKYRIQVDDDSDFSSVFWDSGESGTVMSDCTAGNRCSDISYGGSALSEGITYYWQIKYWDDGDEGAWSTESAYFSVNYTPLAPTSLLAEEQTNPTGVTDTTPEFSAIYNDNDVGDIADYYQIQVDDDPAFGSTLWDSTKTSLSPTCTAGNRCTNISYDGASTDLQWNTKYYWRIKYWDDGAAEGDWSTETASFAMAPIYEPTACMIDDSGQNDQLIVKWSDNTSFETGYRVERSVDGAAYSLLTTENIDATSSTDNTTADDHTYLYRVRANSGNGNSQWCSTETVDYGRGEFHFR